MRVCVWVCDYFLINFKMRKMNADSWFSFEQDYKL